MHLNRIIKVIVEQGAVAKNPIALKNTVPALLTTNSAPHNASVSSAVTLSSRMAACKKTTKTKSGIAEPTKMTIKTKTSISISRMKTTKVK